MLRALPALVLLGIAGQARAVQAPPVSGVTPVASVFAAVPAGMFGGAVVTPSSCGLDVVNYGTASGAAIDHLGSADFQGWVGDSATGKVPASLWLVLDGAQAFYAPARTGVGRPDVAASKHNRAFAQAGFNVTTYLPGLPVGDYRVAIYYRIDGREMVCPTQVTVSVQ